MIETRETEGFGEHKGLMSGVASVLSSVILTIMMNLSKMFIVKSMAALIGLYFIMIVQLHSNVMQLCLGQETKVSWDDHGIRSIFTTTKENHLGENDTQDSRIETNWTRIASENRADVIEPQVVHFMDDAVQYVAHLRGHKPPPREVPKNFFTNFSNDDNTR